MLEIYFVKQLEYRRQRRIMDKKKQKKEQMDDAIENATKLAEVQVLQKQLAELKVDQEDARNQLKRAVADYQNLEKRVNEGRSELTQFVGAELVKRLLPVLDHLEQSLSGISEQEKQSGWVKGVELAVKEFNQVLASEGLDQVATDGAFDPSLHEAVDVKEDSASSSTGETRILEVVRKGYNLNGKVLRPAQVIVGRSQDNHPEERSSDEGSIKEEN